jgi:hypothetical protein
VKKMMLVIPLLLAAGCRPAALHTVGTHRTPAGHALNTVGTPTAQEPTAEEPTAPVKPLSLDAGQALISRLREMCKAGFITADDADYKARIISNRMDSYCEGKR